MAYGSMAYGSMAYGSMAYGSRYCKSLRAGQSGDSIPLGARFYATVQTGPGTHPTSYKMGTGFFQGVNRPRLRADYPPHLVPRLKKE